MTGRGEHKGGEDMEIRHRREGWGKPGKERVKEDKERHEANESIRGACGTKSKIQLLP